MIDFAWSEMALVILVAVMVLGPKELPKAMRTLAQFMRKARKLAGEFQGHWNEMVREAELDEVKTAVAKVTSTNVGTEVEKLIDPSGEFSRELDDTVTKTRTELEAAAQTTPTVPAPAPVAPPATPAAPAPASSPPQATAAQ
jgi:sec-independent protein translocase protein TatB